MGRRENLIRSALIIMTMLLVYPAVANEARNEFHIPASEASKALGLFARQTNDVFGNYTFYQGLEILLRNTGITGSINENGVLTINVSAPEIERGAR